MSEFTYWLALRILWVGIVKKPPCIWKFDLGKIQQLSFHFCYMCPPAKENRQEGEKKENRKGGGMTSFKGKRRICVFGQKHDKRAKSRKYLISKLLKVQCIVSMYKCFLKILKILQKKHMHKPEIA